MSSATLPSNGESGPPCGTPPSVLTNHAVWQHHLGLQQPFDESQEVRSDILYPSRDTGATPWPVLSARSDRRARIT